MHCFPWKQQQLLHQTTKRYRNLISPQNKLNIYIYIYICLGEGGLEFSISLPNTETTNQTASLLCSGVIEGLCFVYVSNTITQAAFGVINTCRTRSCFH